MSTQENKLTHFNADGAPHMVDVSGKPATVRKAIAEARISMTRETLALIKNRGHKKGDVIQIAQLAGIMGAKKTPELIPLCHPVGLSHVHVDIAIAPDADTAPALIITAECHVTAATGVEMEAMTAAATAALTIYDMVKGVDRGMVIESVRLIHKSGGKSGVYDADEKK